MIGLILIAFAVILAISSLGFIAGKSKMARNAVNSLMTGNLGWSNFARDQRGDMVGYAIELTVTLIVLSVLFIPVGYKTWQNTYTNKTTYGVVAGSTDDTLLQYLGTFAILGFFLAFIYAAKQKSGV